MACEANAADTLSWQDCIVEARKNNPDLISAQEVVNQNKADKRIASSTLFPQIDANLSAQTQKTTSESSSGTSSSSTSDDYSYGLTGSQLIFDGFKTIQDVKAAGENINAASYAYRFTSSQVRLNLRTAFINLLRAQELVSVTEDIVRIRRSNFQLISLRYYSGLEHKGALLTAEANLASANYQLAQAKRDIESAQRQITKEMGRKEFLPVQVKGDFVVRENIQDAPDLERIALSNPSLLQAVAKKNSAAFGIKSAYANFSPELTGTLGASKDSAKWPPDKDQWNVGLSLTMPLFEGGLRLAQVDQAKALFRQLEADERSTRDAVIVDLQLAWAGLKDAVEAVQVAYKSLVANQERSKIAEVQYSTGFLTFDNWIIIEDNLVTSKRAYLEAEANALLAEATWVQAKGDTLEYAQK